MFKTVINLCGLVGGSRYICGRLGRLGMSTYDFDFAPYILKRCLPGAMISETVQVEHEPVRIANCDGMG